MWLPEDLAEGKGGADEVVPMHPDYRYSYARLFAHPRFLQLARVWHWEPKQGASVRYVVWYKDARQWTQATAAYANPKDAVREALEALDKSEGRACTL